MLGPVRVLIVDDEEQLARAFRRKLTAEGYVVTTASSAEEGLSLTEKQTFDVALLDIRLPGIDGVQLLEKLRKQEPTMEVIMLTGHASVDTAIQSMKLGAYDYLSKPCKLNELTQVIMKAYEKKALKEKAMVLEEQLARMEVRDKFVGDTEHIREVRRRG